MIFQGYEVSVTLRNLAREGESIIVVDHVLLSATDSMIDILNEKYEKSTQKVESYRVLRHFEVQMSKAFIEANFAPTRFTNYV